jgi:predicted  nucleic acid-binding Zn-ribbon protein
MQELIVKLEAQASDIQKKYTEAQDYLKQLEIQFHQVQGGINALRQAAEVEADKGESVEEKALRDTTD